MRRRRRLLLLAALAVVLGIALIVWLMARPTAITSDNVAKIQLGLTLAEVEVILGGPPRDETTGPIEPVGGWDDWFRFSAMNHAPTHDPEAPVWKTDQLVVQVVLDEAGRVRAKDHVPVHRIEQSLRDMLRRWLHL